MILQLPTSSQPVFTSI